MITYVLRRCLGMIPTLLVISFLIFLIIELPPGDYLSNQMEQLRAQGETASIAKLEFLRQEFALDRPFLLPRGRYGVALFLVDPTGGTVGAAYTNGPAAAPYGNGDLRIHPAGVGCSSISLLGPCAYQPRRASTFPVGGVALGQDVMAGHPAMHHGDGVLAVAEHRDVSSPQLLHCRSDRAQLGHQNHFGADEFDRVPEALQPILTR